MRMFIVFPLIVVFGFLAVLVSCSSARQTNSPDTWRIIKQNKKEGSSYILYNKPHSGSKFLEFRITGAIEEIPENVIKIARNQITKDQYLPKEMKQTILTDTIDLFITYYEINLPFMFRDRDLAIRYDFYGDSATNTYGLKWHDVPELAPPIPEGVIRMKASLGGWNFSPGKNGTTLATFVQFGDLGGKMPAWLVNKMGGKTLIDDLNRLRKLVAEN